MKVLLLKVVELSIPNSNVLTSNSISRHSQEVLFGSNKVYSMKIHYLYLAIWI